MRRDFVDIHTHMLPSGDDGVGSVEEGAALCREAHARGTRLLFATPHVWPHLGLSEERERNVRAAHARGRARAGLELRLGFELTPHPRLLRDDLGRYALEGTGAVLMEVPFLGGARLLVQLAERAEGAGLLPVIAHPERSESVRARPALARDLAARGWLLQANASSLTGRHGPEIADLAWRLVGDGLIALVASDGHRETRPPFLDGAFDLATSRYGNEAVKLFDGSALGLARSSEAVPYP